MLRRRDMMGSKGSGLALHWDYTMGSPLDYGFVASVTEGQAEMQDGGFFLSASSTSACVTSALTFPISDKCPDFEIADGFEFDILVKFKIIKNASFSDLLTMGVYDKNNTYTRCCAENGNKALQIDKFANRVSIVYPSNNEVTQRYVMKDGKLSAYFNEYAKENVVPSHMSSTEEPHIRIQITNNWYNKGITSVLIESIDITLNKEVA